MSKTVDISKYMVKPRSVKAKKRVDWRDYVLPAKGKKKTHASRNVDKIVYGV